MKVPAFRYHGAKFRIAQWVIALMPPHNCYVEPFGGAAGVLLQKPRAYAEVYNDLDGDVVNYFRVLRDPKLLRELLEAIELTPYAREEFEQAAKHTDDPVERARRMVVRSQMGFGSAGATKGRTGFRLDTRRRYGTNQMLWSTFDRNIIATVERFQGVLVENRPAIEVMQQHDADDTLHYVDPPYLHATRVMGPGKSRCYRHEMTDADHAELLQALLGLKGMVMVSGYRHEMYLDALAGWAMHTTNARASAGRGTTVREECLWINPAAKQAHLRAGFGLFKPSIEEMNHGN